MARQVVVVKSSKKCDSGATVDITNNDLFDTSENVDQLSGEHLDFYLDMKGAHISRLSEQIDIAYVEEIAHANETEGANRREAEDIEDYTNLPEFQEVLRKTPIRSERKRLVADSPLEMETEKSTTTTTTVPQPSQPQEPTRIVKKVKEKFKDAIATVSYRTAVSVPKARVATQVVLEKICGHKYYLSVEEKGEG